MDSPSRTGNSGFDIDASTPDVANPAGLRAWCAMSLLPDSAARLFVRLATSRYRTGFVAGYGRFCTGMALADRECGRRPLPNGEKWPKPFLVFSRV